MKIFLLLAILTATFASCSTAYKTGQTPDDVYYSPARLETHDVRRDRDENTTTDNTVYTSTEDREIRRRIRHRRYRSYDDRYNYPYGYNGPVYGNPKYGTTQNTSEPRKTNLGAYKPNTTTTDSTTSTNSKFGKSNTTGTNPVRTFGTPNKTSNNGTGVGNVIRRIFTTENSNYNPNHSNNTNNNNSSSRTFDRSSNNNNNNSSSNTRSSSSDTKTSSSSSSSSSSAPVRTFGKQ